MVYPLAVTEGTVTYSFGNVNKHIRPDRTYGPRYIVDQSRTPSGLLTIGGHIFLL